LAPWPDTSQRRGRTSVEGLLEEVSSYPQPEVRAPEAGLEQAVLVPLKIRTSLGVLSFMSTTTVFGTPVDVTLSELAIELFFPTDQATAEAVRKAGSPLATRQTRRRAGPVV
jgi:hypothetical protein